MIRFSFQKIDQGEKLKKEVIYYNTIEINTIVDLLSLIHQNHVLVLVWEWSSKYLCDEASTDRGSI